eukprot:238151_1
MATLVDPIRLTLLADQLNHDEWSQFLTKLSSSFGRSFILNALKSLKSNDLKSTISMITDIIHSRDEIPSKALPKIQCIDELLPELIGEIGTYLHRKNMEDLSNPIVLYIFHVIHPINYKKYILVHILVSKLSIYTNIHQFVDLYLNLNMSIN